MQNGKPETTPDEKPHVLGSVSTPNVPAATWDQVLNPPEKRARELLGLIRIKCTRRFQSFEYGAEDHQPTTLCAVDATNHLREILALVEEVQKLV
jgi:hypothetical protein